MSGRLIACLAAAALFWSAEPAQSQANTLTVFAAASLKNVLDDVNLAFRAKSAIQVRTSYAASSALVRQIEHGAPSDVFLSADAVWMDYGASKNLIQPGTRFDLLGNSLVLVASRDFPLTQLSIEAGLDLGKLAGGGRVVTGDIRTVPAGRYAKAALDHLGLWDSVAPKLAFAENVRAALALVARGEAPLGIVYATDARVEPMVRVVGTFPPNSHPPIVYPAALTVTAQSQAKHYLEFLRTSAARAIFERHGFAVLPEAKSE